jgi:hypothetical protein
MTHAQRAGRAGRGVDVPEVIVGLASFPRPGNTLLRIALNRLYGET